MLRTRGAQEICVSRFSPCFPFVFLFEEKNRLRVFPIECMAEDNGNCMKTADRAGWRTPKAIDCVASTPSMTM